MKFLMILLLAGNIIQLDSEPNELTHQLIGVVEVTARSANETDPKKFDRHMDTLELALEEELLNQVSSKDGDAYLVVVSGVREIPVEVQIGKDNYKVILGVEIYKWVYVYKLRSKFNV